MAKKKTDTHSPAYQLFQHVWGNFSEATAHSWGALNQSMRSAMHLAINAGLRFDLDDFGKTNKAFRGGYWFGDTEGEWFYTLAVQAGNLSAAHAFESWKGRQPFIADDVYPGANHSHNHLIGSRKRGRLAVDFHFPWQGVRVKVTSFAADGTYLTACTYAKREPGDYSNKVAKRFRITPADIQTDHRARKKQLAESED